MQHHKTVIQTGRAPGPDGPASQAIAFGGLLFISAQSPRELSTNQLILGGIEAQTRLVMEHLKMLLHAAGLDFSHAMRATLYLKNMADLRGADIIYSEYFDAHPPARSVVEVSRLPHDALITIDLIAATPAPAPDAEPEPEPAPEPSSF